ncbi:Lymphocyte antigen 86 [Galemys pyrenaicus]|uniref:Lymphocyte antigen 86 n=1 Tax=Galemys pyrenaicus TaxID=202257 RepID=A0A8J6A0K1_GALPY|nr:Lymphocyte antigen 86 [Galemys pyrenaicus]
MGTGLGSYCLPRGLAMGGLTAALLLFTLVSPGSVCGTAWPTHTACSSGDVEVRYQSCGKEGALGLEMRVDRVQLTALGLALDVREVVNVEEIYHCLSSECPLAERPQAHTQSVFLLADPLQDFGFSIDQCSRQLKSNLNIRFGIILREDIRELFLEVALFSKGESILNFSYPICEEDLPKFSFCGRRKGGKWSVSFTARRDPGRAATTCSRGPGSRFSAGPPSSPPPPQSRSLSSDLCVSGLLRLSPVERQLPRPSGLRGPGASAAPSATRPPSLQACTFMPWIQACTGLTGPRSHTHPFQGEYQVLLQLHDRDQALVACANATVISF